MCPGRAANPTEPEHGMSKTGDPFESGIRSAVFLVVHRLTLSCFINLRSGRRRKCQIRVRLSRTGYPKNTPHGATAMLSQLIALAIGGLFIGGMLFGFFRGLQIKADPESKPLTPHT